MEEGAKTHIPSSKIDCVPIKEVARLGCNALSNANYESCEPRRQNAFVYIKRRRSLAKSRFTRVLINFDWTTAIYFHFYWFQLNLLLLAKLYFLDLALRAHTSLSLFCTANGTEEVEFMSRNSDWHILMLFRRPSKANLRLLKQIWSKSSIRLEITQNKWQIYVPLLQSFSPNLISHFQFSEFHQNLYSSTANLIISRGCFWK